MSQLAIFQEASCQVSQQDKATRMFYLERMVKSIRSALLIDFIVSITYQILTMTVGGRGLEHGDMLASLTAGNPPVVTPAGARRRIIRCKRCR